MKAQDPGLPKSSMSNDFGRMAIFCFAYSIFALLLLHVLRRDYSPRSHMVSDYGVGPYSWVMTTCFLAMGCGLLMLLLGLLRHGPRSGIGRAGSLLLSIPAIGVVVSAIFPTDLLGAPATRAGAIHDISFLVNVVVIMVGATLVSIGFLGDSHWRKYGRIAIALSCLIVVAFVLQFITLHKGMPYGYTNRLFLLVLFGWFFGAAHQLRVVMLYAARSPTRR